MTIRVYAAYTPHDWFWIVGGDDSQAWSTAVGGYVTEWPADRVTRIASEIDLTDVLRPLGLVLPAPTQVDYTDAIQEHVDAIARARQYRDGFALASYISSTVPSWASEAAAFVAWRDAVWAYVYSEFAKVQSAERAQPSIAALIAELPTIEWPAP